jgi:putative transcriptional regulator
MSRHSTGFAPTLDEMAVLPRLKPLRLKAGLSQAELAERAGLQRTTVNRLESARTFYVPHPATLRALAKALGVTVSDLWGPMDPPV